MVFYQIADIISITSVILPFLILLLYIKQRHIKYIIALVFVYIIHIIVVFIKNTSVKIFPNAKILYRPNKKAKCNSLNKYDGLVYGFPSGHVANTFFMLCVIKEYIYGNIGVIVWIILMGWSRWYKGCHNIFQIISGLLLGLLMYYLFTLFIKITLKSKTN